MMNLTLPAAQEVECDQYMDEVAERYKVLAVITPLRITKIANPTNFDAYKISFGCNLWKSCKNVGCSYCHLASQ